MNHLNLTPYEEVITGGHLKSLNIMLPHGPIHVDMWSNKNMTSSKVELHFHAMWYKDGRFELFKRNAFKYVYTKVME